MPISLFTTLLIAAQFLFPVIAGDVQFTPTLYQQAEQVRAVYLPVELPMLPISRDRYPVKNNQENLGPNITAQSAIAIDFETGMTLWQKNPETILPIASLSKLMTALILMDLDLDWQRQVTIDGEDNATEGARLKLPTGAEVSLEDVLRAMLVSSANNATMTLASESGLALESFVVKMNEKATALGCQYTNFEEPTGLSANNVSTVNDYALIARAAFTNEKIRQITIQASHEMETSDGRQIRVYNTDKLINNSFLDIKGSKTGYIPEAGYCLTLLSDNQEKNSHTLSVVLNSTDLTTRQTDSEIIHDWTHSNYTWPVN